MFVAEGRRLSAFGGCMPTAVQASSPPAQCLSTVPPLLSVSLSSSKHAQCYVAVLCCACVYVCCPRWGVDTVDQELAEPTQLCRLLLSGKVRQGGERWRVGPERGAGMGVVAAHACRQQSASQAWYRLIMLARTQHNIPLVCCTFCACLITTTSCPLPSLFTIHLSLPTLHHHHHHNNTHTHPSPARCPLYSPCSPVTPHPFSHCHHHHHNNTLPHHNTPPHSRTCMCPYQR